VLIAQPRQETPAEILLVNDHEGQGGDATWYPTGDENTLTAGDIKVVDHLPQLVDYTVRPSATPPAYDWHTDTGRASSAAPYGRSRHGDIYTREGNTYHTVGGSPTPQPLELLTRWLERLLVQLNGTRGSPDHDEYVRYMRPVVSPISHHNRWERAAAQFAAMDISRDRVIRISTPSVTRDSRVVPYRADPRSEVYDGSGTRLLTYTPNPHDERPARQFDIRIKRFT